MRTIVACALALGFALVTTGALAQSGLYVYPQKGQSKDQQEKDEFACYKWAKEQSGVDPSAPAPNQGNRAGATARGAARGAAGGAVIGGIAGDAGKGAAAGAAAGGVRGRRQEGKRRQAAQAQTRNSYDRAFAACMEARGYTVR